MRAATLFAVLLFASAAGAAPTVTDCDISGGTAISIAIRAHIQFSEAMDPETITKQTCKIATTAGGVPVLADATYRPATNACSLRPVNSLAYSTAYTVTIVGGSSGVKNVAGVPLAADYTCLFTTEPPLVVYPTVTGDLTGDIN